MFLLGFYDDLRISPPVPVPGPVRIGLSCYWVFLAPRLPDVPLWQWVLPGWAWVVPGAFWVVWMLNLYNFMDGIDGLRGRGGRGVLLLFPGLRLFGQSGWAVANLVVAAASMGFLVHNWPPGEDLHGGCG